MRVPTFIISAVIMAALASVSWATIATLTFRDVQTTEMEAFESSCLEAIEQSEMDTVAHGQAMLVYRSTTMCQTGSSGTFCATQFVTTGHPNACSPIYWTRGSGEIIDDIDPLADHFARANQTLTGLSVFMGTIEGSLLAGPTDDGISVHNLQ